MQNYAITGYGTASYKYNNKPEQWKHWLLNIHTSNTQAARFDLKMCTGNNSHELWLMWYTFAHATDSKFNFLLN